MTNYSLITLGVLLSSENETIKRNAVSILKVLQKEKDFKMAYKENDIESMICLLSPKDRAKIQDWLNSASF